MYFKKHVQLRLDEGYTIMVAKTMYLIVVILLCSNCKSENEVLESGEADQLTIEDFSFLMGSWDGALEYLNYGDDKTLVTLPTRAVYAQKKDKITYRFIYTEPSGDEVNGKGSIKIESENEIAFNGATHKIVDVKKEPADELVQVKITRRGKDNGEDAQIDHVIERKEDTLTITRYILLDGATAPFIRHTYTFNPSNE